MRAPNVYARNVPFSRFLRLPGNDQARQVEVQRPRRGGAACFWRGCYRVQRTSAGWLVVAVHTADFPVSSGRFLDGHSGPVTP